MTPLSGPGPASRPTLSRIAAALAAPTNLQVRREAVLELVGWGIPAERVGQRARFHTRDVHGSAPIEVHGHQAKAEWNAYYAARIYHR